MTRVTRRVQDVGFSCPPDAATCDDCLAELFEPADRRHRYPFIGCTACGPRFAIVTALPYDRANTTMAGFTMCAACRAEYEDRGGRRFHAQAIACPDCGPRLRLAGEDAADPVAAAAAAVLGGAILAVKGLGGLQLACRADDEAVVARLRGDAERPFAVMVRDVAAARALVELDGDELAARERPIVIAPRRGEVAPSVAPRTRELGVLLPHTPLQHLLLAGAAGVPLVIAGGAAAGLADAFLDHDLPIRTAVDDSVIRDGRIVRRSRGFVPVALPLPAGPPLLAAGAGPDSTFTLARDRRAWIGDTQASLPDGVEHFQRLFAIEPELIAHDRDPQHPATRYALGRAGEHVAVQHHHAHLAAALAEHGAPRALGAIYDGGGRGIDGTDWGGELLLGDLAGFERAGHLWPVPGGDAALREPRRMACAWLAAAGCDAPPEWEGVDALAGPSPETTSMGRLFDAVAALCGLRETVSYAGQAALALEAAADASERRAYPLPVARGATARLVLDARPTIVAVRDELAAGVAVGIVSARFHNAVARATAVACAEIGAPVVALSGGVFENALLRARTVEALSAKVLVPRRVPCNDGGISYGQAAIAAWTHS